MTLKNEKTDENGNCSLTGNLTGNLTWKDPKSENESVFWLGNGWNGLKMVKRSLFEWFEGVQPMLEVFKA